jgi:hypothetical protein
VRLDSDAVDTSHGKTRVTLPPPIREPIRFDETVRIDGPKCRWITVDATDRLVAQPIPNDGRRGVAFGVVLTDGSRWAIWTPIEELPGGQFKHGPKEERWWLNLAGPVQVLDVLTERTMRRHFPAKMVNEYLAWCDNQERR